MCLMLKTVGTGALFEKSYKNIRTKKSRYPLGYLDFKCLDGIYEHLFSVNQTARKNFTRNSAEMT